MLPSGVCLLSGRTGEGEAWNGFRDGVEVGLGVGASSPEQLAWCVEALLWKASPLWWGHHVDRADLDCGQCAR